MGILDFLKLGGEYRIGGVRAAKRGKSTIGILVSAEDDEELKCAGYTSLARNPEVFTACRKIAQLISSMPIMLMKNGPSGDERIFNELSRKIDIEPCKGMTRRTWMEFIVMNLLLYGKGNSVVTVKTSRGLISNLEPISAARVSFDTSIGGNYRIIIDGVSKNPNDLLHFVDNPDRYNPKIGKGLTVVLQDAADNLKQAAATRKGFMSSKWKPSIIVKVDALAEEFSSPEGRKKLLDSYVRSSSAGEPWLIPADQFDVTSIHPLSLNDLAISEGVEIDKRTIASILGVPPFVLGVGTYSSEEWNSFISNTVRPIAQEIEQELTKKLILNPEWYLQFNVRSLMNWDIRTIAEVFCMLGDRGYVDGNEVRDQIGMSPREGLDELRVLENYIPYDMGGLQKKLVQPGEE